MVSDHFEPFVSTSIALLLSKHMKLWHTRTMQMRRFSLKSALVKLQGGAAFSNLYGTCQASTSQII